MSTIRRATRLILTGVAAMAFAGALTFAADGPTVRNQAEPCYNGATRLDPYANSCTIPGPKHKIRGSAPDANAIIACRNVPGCLSWYVNNP